jgi:hypothetical protein
MQNVWKLFKIIYNYLSEIGDPKGLRRSVFSDFTSYGSEKSEEKCGNMSTILKARFNANKSGRHKEWRREEKYRISLKPMAMSCGTICEIFRRSA